MALIGMIVALVFIVVSFFGPWYGVSFLGYSTNVGLITEVGTGVNRGSIDTTMIIAIIAIITAILALIGMAGVTFNFGKFKTMKFMGGIFGLLTFILALIAPLYFMSSALLEGMDDIGFWNQYGGPGYGWYLMFVAAIIALIASIAMLLKKSVPEVATQPPQ